MGLAVRQRKASQRLGLRQLRPCGAAGFRLRAGRRHSVSSCCFLGIHLLAAPVVELDALQALFHLHEVREDQLLLHRAEVRSRGAVRPVVADHLDQGVAVLHGQPGVGLLLLAALAGEEIVHLGIDGLLGLEHPAERSTRSSGTRTTAEPVFAAGGGFASLAGQGLEGRGPAGERQPDDTEFHGSCLSSSVRSGCSRVAAAPAVDDQDRRRWGRPGR